MGKKRMLRTLKLKSVIKFARDLENRWEEKNSVLQEGEKVYSFSVDSQNRISFKIKIGDGKTPYNDLPDQKPQLVDSLGDDMIKAPTQKAITEGIDSIKTELNKFSYQEII